MIVVLPSLLFSLMLYHLIFLPLVRRMMDPFLPVSVFFFVVCFILVNGGGLTDVLFGAAIIATLSLMPTTFPIAPVWIGLTRGGTSLGLLPWFIASSFPFWSRGRFAPRVLHKSPLFHFCIDSVNAVCSPCCLMFIAYFRLALFPSLQTIC